MANEAIVCNHCGREVQEHANEIVHEWHVPNKIAARVIEHSGQPTMKVDWQDLKTKYPHEWNRVIDNQSLDCIELNQLWLGSELNQVRQANYTISDFQAAISQEVQKDKCEGMPKPTSFDLANMVFHAIYQTINSWDINVPEFYQGYCGGNQSHAKLIHDAIAIVVKSTRIEEAKATHEKKTNKFAPKNKRVYEIKNG